MCGETSVEPSAIYFSSGCGRPTAVPLLGTFLSVFSKWLLVKIPSAGDSLKTWEGRGGISILVSNVLMLAVVVGMATLVMAFVNLYVVNYQRGHGGALEERLLIEDVWFKDGTLDVTIYNYGRIDVKVVTVFIDGATSWEGEKEIRIGEHETLTLSHGWTAGETYVIKLLTDRGATFEGDHTAPGL